MSKQKRMIYIYEENVQFYDKLKNKSEFINEQLTRARVGVRKEPTRAEKIGRDNIDFIKAKLESIGK